MNGKNFRLFIFLFCLSVILVFMLFCDYMINGKSSTPIISLMLSVLISVVIVIFTLGVEKEIKEIKEKSGLATNEIEEGGYNISCIFKGDTWRDDRLSIVAISFKDGERGSLPKRIFYNLPISCLKGEFDPRAEVMHVIQNEGWKYITLRKRGE